MKRTVVNEMFEEHLHITENLRLGKSTCILQSKRIHNSLRNCNVVSRTSWNS